MIWHFSLNVCLENEKEIILFILKEVIIQSICIYMYKSTYIFFHLWARPQIVTLNSQHEFNTTFVFKLCCSSTVI